MGKLKSAPLAVKVEFWKEKFWHLKRLNYRFVRAIDMSYIEQLN